VRDLQQIWQGAGFERPGVLTAGFKACFCADNGINTAMDDLSITIKSARKTKQTMKFAPNFFYQYDVFICIRPTMIVEALISKEILHVKTVN